MNTERLSLCLLTNSDKEFILELVNTEGWLKFIGNRNINNSTDAESYINKILANENIRYWVVKLKKTKEKIGIITFIKKDYLDYHDIGFAFLPQYGQKGYALEATKAVLSYVIEGTNKTSILATTIPENKASIALLTKLGFKLQKSIQSSGDQLNIFEITVENLKVKN